MINRLKQAKFTVSAFCVKFIGKVGNLLDCYMSAFNLVVGLTENLVILLILENF